MITPALKKLIKNSRSSGSLNGLPGCQQLDGCPYVLIVTTDAVLSGGFDRCIQRRPADAELGGKIGLAFACCCTSADRGNLVGG